MNKYIIKRYNEIVNDDDTVYHLGDFTMAGPNRKHGIELFVRKLKGTKIIVLGNHDKLRALDYVDIGFQSAHTFLHLEQHDLFLTHDPAVASILLNKRWIHGHVHNLWKFKDTLVNVSVDVWDFKPVSLNQILEYYESRE